MHTLGTTAPHRGARAHAEACRTIAAQVDRLSHAGRHAAGERILRESAAAFARRRAYRQAAHLGVDLGRHLLERGRSADAARALAEAAGEAERGAEPDLVALAQSWRAAALIDAGDLETADHACRGILAMHGVPAATRACTLASRIRIHLWQNRVADAAAIASEWDPSAGGGEPYALGTLARLEIRRGRIFEAGRIVETLLQTAPEPGDALRGLLVAAARLRLDVAVGRIEAARRACERIDEIAGTARWPLRRVRARLLLAEGLDRAGFAREARQMVDRLRRYGTAPGLLRRTILEWRTGPGGCRPGGTPAAPWPETDAVARALAQVTRGRCDTEGRAVALDLSARALGASGAALFVGAGGALRCLAQSGLPGGGSAADAAGRLGAAAPGGQDGTGEWGVPLRDVTGVVGVLAVTPSHTGDGAWAERAGWIASTLAPWVAAGIVEDDPRDDAALMPELVGVSRGLCDLRQAVRRAAAAPFAVLVEGESGAGKELVARAIHRLGPRREGPFRDLNCAALVEDLVDAELFGHARGAFTGALHERPGLIEEASSGTLFLDELADLSLRAQAKLLRVLQEREVRRVGEVRGRAVDVRVVSAVNVDLRVRAAEGRFRQDLLYRLDVIRVTIPPLRERLEDVPVLARHFWRDVTARAGSAAVLGTRVIEALMRYHWPGNVRELQNVIAALCVRAPAHGEAEPQHLPCHVEAGLPASARTLVEARLVFERQVVAGALAAAHGRRSAAARALGLSRQGLAKLLRRHQLDAPRRGM